MDWIYESWSWYFSGFMIAVVMFLLLLTGKAFGMSANLRIFCSACGAGRKHDFFDFDWKKQKWNLTVALGSIIGGFIASNFLTTDSAVIINEDLIEPLSKLGIDSTNKSYLPTELFATENLTDIKTLLILTIGGLLVGFGARYAGGCTSGHAISGLSNLQFPSLIAVIGFFIGGLTMVHFLFPLIF